MHFMIVPDDDRGLIVFGFYYIEFDKDLFTVKTWDREIHKFASKRAALAWCTADKLKQYSLANNILILDRKKQILAADIYCRKTVGERGATEMFYEIVNMKIQPKIDQYNMVTTELEKCINSAKYLQIKGFNNETARTSGH